MSRHRLPCSSGELNDAYHYVAKMTSVWRGIVGQRATSPLHCASAVPLPRKRGRKTGISDLSGRSRMGFLVRCASGEKQTPATLPIESVYDPGFLPRLRVEGVKKSPEAILARQWLAPGFARRRTEGGPCERTPHSPRCSPERNPAACTRPYWSHE